MTPSTTTEKTRQRLVAAFCAAYAEKPFEKITVREVVKAAGCSRSNFYLHYTNLAELRTEVEDTVLAAIRQIMAADEASNESQFIAQATALYAAHEQELTALLGEYGSAAFKARFKAELVNAFPKVFAAKQDQFFPYLVEYHISTILSLFQLWLKRKKDLPRAELFRMIDSLLIR